MYSENDDKAKEQAKQMAKKAAKAKVKQMIKAKAAAIIGSLGGGTIAIFVAVFVITVIFILALFIGFDHFSNNVEPNKSGSFQDETIELGNKNEFSGDNIVSSELGVADAIAGIFYNRFSEQSYYVMIDDDPTIYQAGSEEWKAKGNIKDIDNRETQFALSPKMLQILDNELNQGFKNPEQLIRPLYNTCMDEPNDTDTECKLKQLVDKNGALQVKSTYYRERSRDDVKVSDVVGEQEEPLHTDELSVYDRNINATTNGVWNWGLGSIIHYKSFQQSSRINDYKIEEAEIWDAEARKKVSIPNFSDQKESEEYIKEYGMIKPNRVITYETQAEENANTISGLSLAVPANETKYAIDRATIYAGDIKNDVKQTWVYQGDSQATSMVSNYFHEYPSSMEDNVSDPDAVRVAYMGSYGQIKRVDMSDSASPFGMLATGVPVKKFTGEVHFEPRETTIEIVDNPNCTENNANLGVCEPTIEQEKEVHPDQYKFSDGSVIEAPEGGLSFTVLYNPQLSYMKEGELQTFAVRYVNTNPDTSGIKGIDYLEDYIKNYEAYIPYKTEGEVAYKCINTGIASEENNWDAEQLLNLSSSLANSDDYSGKVGFPESCANNQIAIKESQYASMTRFNFEEQPELQLTRTANLIGYRKDKSGELAATEDSFGPTRLDMVPYKEGSSAQSESYKSRQALFNSRYQTYGKQIKKSAAKYGIDRNLLTFIATTGNDGNLCNVSQYIGETIDVYDFAKRQNSSIYIDANKLSSADDNIEYAAAILQKVMMELNYNIPMGIEAYAIGVDGVKNTLFLYEKDTGTPVDQAINNTTDITWTDYLCWFISDNYGSIDNNKILVQLVAKELVSSSNIAFQSANSEDGSLHSLKMFNFKDTNRSIESSNVVANINRYRINSMYTRVKDKLPNEWPMIYLNEKSYYAGSYAPSTASEVEGGAGQVEVKNIQSGVVNNLPQTAEYIYSELSDDSTDLLIRKIFTADEGRSPDELKDMSPRYWKSKFGAMFRTVGSKEWSSHINVEKLFGGIPVYPVLSSTTDKPFGYIRDDYGVDEFNPMLVLAVMPNDEVRSIADGIVSDVNTIDGVEFGKYVEITYQGKDNANDSQETIDEEETDNSDEESLIVVRYALLGDINVKLNDKVKAGDVIGRTGNRKSENTTSNYSNLSSTLGLMFTIDGEYYNPDDLFSEAARIENEMGIYEDISSSNSWWDTGMTPPDAPNMDFGGIATLDGWYIGDMVDLAGEYGGRMSAGTWFYNNSSTGHPGLDWATRSGTPVYAMSDMIVIIGEANCMNAPYGGDRGSGGCDPKRGNRIVYVFKHNNGNYYMIKNLHLSESFVSAGQFVAAGTNIGLSGNSGMSSGPHVHIEIINLGSGYSDLGECYNAFKGNEYPVDYLAYGRRCESTTNTPCKERPDYVFGLR